MKQLQTYIALYATLIAGFAMCIIGGLAVFAFGASPITIYVIVLVAVLVLIVSMAVGHYLSEPLRALVAHVRAYRRANQRSVSPESSQYQEVNDLASEFSQLAAENEAYRSKLAAIENSQSAFVSDVAHELRTPLTAIRGNAEMLADPDLPPELHERFCNSIVRESERLSRLTTDLISLQRTKDEDKATEWRRVDLHKVVQDAVDALAPVIHERQAHISIEGEAPDVLGNYDRLVEVVTNLVDNATRFIEPGGHIWIEIAGTESSSVISVSDDGAGFGDIDPRMLFERFYRSDFSRARNAGGSGLGLAIVKSIVEAHDGSVEAFNRPEGGACFLVAIPSIESSK
ncbi:MAG: sensor histidine kinase [Eggerthellaceae bacterium]|jgi:two-component system OmpR family sensor kinase